MAHRRYGAEEARARLPELLERAHRGSTTLITRHGKPYALLVPPGQARAKRGASVLALEGSGAGLWGHDPAAEIAAVREEWS